MNCLIKNIPPISYGLPGNRGGDFPLAEFCVGLIIKAVNLDDGCYLIEENKVDLYTESKKLITVDCGQQIQGAQLNYLVSRQNPNIQIVDIEFRESIHVS